MPDLLLTADQAPTDLVAVTAAQPITASIEARTITGIVAPYGEPGMTSAGLVTILPGAIRLPDDLSRVKLLEHHSNAPGTPPEAVGVAISATDTADGLVMTFRVATTPAGDLALTAAREGVKDSLSVELIRVDLHRSEVRDGYLTAVAHVPIPAFAGARVLDVAASHHPDQEDTMTREQRQRLAELRGLSTLTQDEAVELAELAALDTEDEPPAEEAATADEAPATGDQNASTDAAATTDVAAAHAPATLTATTGASTSSRTLVASMNADSLFGLLARVGQGERSPELTAALEDIAYSGSPFAEQPEYVGELWNGNEYQRRYVPLLDTSAPLKSLKVKGWSWDEEPDVDDWAGDKSDVPSNEVSWTETEYTASRLAGAHDLAREWWDFGNTEAINAFYRAQANNYARRTDQKALAAIIANATGTTTAIGDVLKAAAIAAQEVDDQTDGVAATYVLVNPADKLSLLDIPAKDVSAFLRDILGIAPGNFKTAATVPVGTVIAGTRKAIKFRELPGVPIRVTAEHIAKGGRDSGLFGYWLAQPEFPNGVRKVTFGPAEPEPEV